MVADAQWPTAAALAWVPGVREGAAPQRIEQLLGGTINESWRVDTAEGRFVLRIDGPAWRRPGVDRGRELGLHEAAGRAGLAPRLLVRSDADGLQVCEFLDGCSWSELDFLQRPQLRRLGERLAQLHALEVPAGIVPFDPVGCARQYLQAMSIRAAAAPRTVAVVAEIEVAAQRVAEGTAQLSIVHGDLTHTNVLDGARLWLLDWEYAQRADPLYDAACALAYYPQAQPQAEELLAAAELAGAGVPMRLEAAIRVYDGLSRLWLWARASPRSD